MPDGFLPAMRGGPVRDVRAGCGYLAAGRVTPDRELLHGLHCQGSQVDVDICPVVLIASSLDIPLEVPARQQNMTDCIRCCYLVYTAVISPTKVCALPLALKIGCLYKQSMTNKIRTYFSLLLWSCRFDLRF